MKYALVDNSGIIQNLIEYSERSEYKPAEGLAVKLVHSHLAIGQHVDAPALVQSSNIAFVPVKQQLLEIDAKKIRAITDAILTGDKTRLQQLEEAAVLLRPHVTNG